MQITTLIVHKQVNSVSAVFLPFPNLKKLQIQLGSNYYGLHEHKFLDQLDRLVIVCDGHQHYNLNSRVKLTEHVWPTSILRVANGKEVEVDPVQDLTYEEFYSYYGVSKLSQS